MNYIEELEEFVVKILEEEKAKGKPDEEKDLEDQETKEENLKDQLVQNLPHLQDSSQSKK